MSLDVFFLAKLCFIDAVISLMSYIFLSTVCLDTLNPKPQNELIFNCAITFAFILQHYACNYKAN